ncbi:MAG: outer-membrane lipoprotein carrier protein LolA [Alphaproteobacteria bacterium]
MMIWMLGSVLGLALVGQAMAVETAVQNDVAAGLVEGYFNGMGTYQARFTQRTTGEQWTQEGMFYLKRPTGQFVWNYESPDRQRLIATGTKLYFVNDEQGGAVTELPVKSGLSRLFTGKKLSLEKEGLRVVNAFTEAKKLTVVMAAKPVKGGTDMGGMQQVALTFDADAAGKPVALVKASVVDATDAVTDMVFKDVKQGGAMNPKMFKFTPALGQL